MGRGPGLAPLGAAALALAAGLGAPLSALAHGALPEATDVHLVETAAGPRLVVETTWGLLHEGEGGRFSLTCDEALGEGDKAWVVLAGGGFGAAHPGGFSRFVDGCRGESARAPASWPLLALAPSASTLYVLTLADDPSRALLRSRDGGLHFEPLPVPAGLRLNGLVHDTDRAGVLHATALDGARAYHLLSTEDGGDTWRARELGAGGVWRVMAAAAGRVVLRRATEGGFELFAADEAEGVPRAVLSTRGLPSLVSWTGPGEWWAATEQGELYASPDLAAWRPVEVPARVRCVRRLAGRLHACVADLARGVALVASDDGGESWADVLRWREVTSVAACGEETTVGAACGPIGADLLAQLVPPPAAPPPPGGAATADGAGPRAGCASANADGLALLAAALAALPYRRRRG